MIGHVGLITIDLRVRKDFDDCVATTDIDEATQTVGQTRTDVIITDELSVKGDSPNEGRTRILGGVDVLDCAMDATPDII